MKRLSLLLIVLAAGMTACTLTDSNRKEGPVPPMTIQSVAEAERVERFFGVGSGVEIVSKPGEGTCVTLRLAHARERLTDARLGMNG